MSRDSPGTSCKLGLTGCPEDPMWDVPGHLGHPCKLGLTRCPEDPMRDVLGQSWDILQVVGNVVIGLSEKEYPMTLGK